MQLKRAFLAINLSPSLKEEISKKLRPLREEYPFFRWVQPKNYHITLYFHGYTRNLNNLSSRIEEVIYPYVPFYIFSRKVDVFINSKILLYLGFRREKQMEKIAFKLYGIFHPGMKQKKFIPHITLARYKIPSKQQYFALKKRLKKVELNLEFKVTHLTLFESLRLESGSVYKEIKKFKLEDF